MNRDEFCNKLQQAKIESGVRTSDLSFQLKMLLPTLRRFEKGIHNFGLNKLLQYVNILGYEIVVINNKTKINIGNYDEMLQFLKKTRSDNGSMREVSKMIEVSYQNISQIENNKVEPSIDYFLKISNINECEITIKKK